MAPAGADFPELINWMREEDKIGDLDEPEYREIAGGLDLAFLTQLFTDPVRTADGMKAIVHIGEVVNEFFLSKTSQVWCRRPGILPTMCSCARDWFREIDFGDEIGVKEFPGPPYRLSVTPAEIGPPPRLGEHNEEVLSSLQAAQGQERTMTKRPLAGIRVADFSWFAAGPIAGQTLATFGAEVVRVESETKIDSLRVVQPVALNEDGTPKSSYNASGYFNNFNAAKLGMQLNVNSEKGQEIAHRLIAQCDIFLTNFTPGVVERWQLSYEKLREVNPGIIAVYSPMQGLEGPHKDFLGFGAVLTPVIGINELSGFAHQPPIGVGTNYPDYCVNPGHTTTAILSAIRHKRRTGEGQLIELSQVESVVNALGSAVPNYLATGEIETRTGNRSRIAVPHGAFRCLDDEESVNSTDRWVTIACRDDLEWSATCAAFEQDSVATDDRFSTVEARRANEDELEELISSWTKDRRAEDVMNMLQQAGVPSGVVQTSQDILDRDPHMQTRGFYQYMEHAETGVSAYDGPAAKLSLTPGYHSAPAPLLGEHTQDVCQRILGLSEDEIADLIVEGVLT